MPKNKAGALSNKTVTPRDPDAFFKEIFDYFDSVRPHHYKGRYLWDFCVSKNWKVISMCSKGIHIPECFIDRNEAVNFIHSNKFPRWFMGIDNAMKVLGGKKIITIFDKHQDVLFLKVA